MFFLLSFGVNKITQMMLFIKISSYNINCYEESNEADL